MPLCVLSDAWLDADGWIGWIVLLQTILISSLSVMQQPERIHAFDAEVVAEQAGQAKRRPLFGRAVGISTPLETFRQGEGPDGRSLFSSSAGNSFSLLTLTSIHVALKASDCIVLEFNQEELVLKPLPGNADSLCQSLLSWAAYLKGVSIATLSVGGYESEAYIKRAELWEPVRFVIHQRQLVCYPPGEHRQAPISKLPLSSIVGCNVVGKEKTLSGMEQEVVISYGSGVLLEIVLSGGNKRLMAVATKECASAWRQELLPSRRTLSTTRLSRTSGSSRNSEIESTTILEESIGEEMQSFTFPSVTEDSMTMEMPEAGGGLELHEFEDVQMVKVERKQQPESNVLARNASRGIGVVMGSRTSSRDNCGAAKSASSAFSSGNRAPK